MSGKQETAFVGMPSTGQIVQAAAGAFYGCSRRNRVSLATVAGSNLAMNFDSLLCTALNLRALGQPVAWFAMQHADVVPPDRWIDALIDEAKRVKADVLSCVIAIREPGGKSSTALSTDNRFQPQGGLTVEALKKLPRTFCIDDCVKAGLCGPDSRLLVNTGCWVADLTKPWWTEADDGGVAALNFEIETRRVRRPDGTWVAETDTEDWRLSRMLAERGARVYATTALEVYHVGPHEWPMGGTDAGEWVPEVKTA